MDSLEDICEKYAIQNALEFDEAKVDLVMRIIIRAHPELKKEAPRVKDMLSKTIERINSLEKAVIKKIAQKKYPEILKETKASRQAVEEVDFIRAIINEDMKTNKFNRRVHTRFPPEPNGYLHIGHAYSINLNYGIAKEYDGKFNLRFDDTNPVKEEAEYVKSIIEDVKWLGADFEDRLFFASNYFDTFYKYAIQLIKKGLAYVDDQTVDELREMRGDVLEPGKESPYRNRSIKENLDLFERMKNGEFHDGAKVLRAKIDMSSPNPMLRDPIIYRILHASHHNTGDKWCIYPLYDFAHGFEDSIEGITHSICTMEFDIHRPLYNWLLEHIDDENGKLIHHPQQIEFARMNLNYMVMSKRKLLILVQKGIVKGWDDPRMPTIAGLRRRGVTPDAIRNLCKIVGLSRRETVRDISIFDNCIREDLNNKCARVMSVLHPLKVVITNYPEDKEEIIKVPNHPENEKMGKREIKFTKTLYIEQDDFMENPTPDFYRLAPNKEVRLKYAYIIKCEKVIKDKATGKIKELHCSYFPETKGGIAEEKRIQGTIHWISANHAIKAEMRLYDLLFTKENPLDVEEGKDFTDYINPKSLEIVFGYIEPFLKNAEKNAKYQFERLGYFNVDPVDSKKGKPIFNRIITLRDIYTKKIIKDK